MNQPIILQNEKSMFVANQELVDQFLSEQPTSCAPGESHPGLTLMDQYIKWLEEKVLSMGSKRGAE
jgi:hypothetical protein